MAAQDMKPGNFAMNISGGDYLDKPVLDQYGEECIIFCGWIGAVRTQGGCDKGVVDGG